MQSVFLFVELAFTHRATGILLCGRAIELVVFLQKVEVFAIVEHFRAQKGTKIQAGANCLIASFLLLLITRAQLVFQRFELFFQGFVGYTRGQRPKRLHGILVLGLASLSTAGAKLFPTALDAADTLAGGQRAGRQCQAYASGFAGGCGFRVIVVALFAQRTAQLALRCAVITAAHHIAASLAMLAVKLVQSERFEHHLVDIAKHVVQTKRVRLEQTGQLQLAIGGLRPGEPFVGV